MANDPTKIDWSQFDDLTFQPSATPVETDVVPLWRDNTTGVLRTTLQEIIDLVPDPSSALSGGLDAKDDLTSQVDGERSSWQLSVTPASVNNLLVVIGNAVLTSGYSLSGDVLTLVAAPASGTPLVVYILSDPAPATAGGNPGNVQYKNDSNVLAGEDAFDYDEDTNTLTVENITLSGTIDGRDPSADGAVLDGIAGNPFNLDARYYTETEVDALIDGAAGTISVNDEGSEIVAEAVTLNFVGDAVSATDSGSGVVTVTVTSGAAPVDSVFGRTGVVVAASGDYDADEITETASRIFYTTTEETKLAGIAEGATADGATGDAYAVSHEADTTAHTAANIVNVPAGNIAATTVQTALNELDTEKAPLASPTFTGTVTVPNDSFTYGKIQNTSAGSKLLGRGDSGAGDVQELSLGANLTITGTTLSASSGTATLGDGDYTGVAVSGSGTVITVNADTINNAKLANMSASRIKGRVTAGTGDPEDLTPNQLGTLFDAAYNSSFWRDAGGVNIVEDGTVAGDGSTDDGAAINAILAAAGVGATIYFPASEYKTSVPLVPLAQQTLVGIGGFGAVELIADGVTGAIIQPNAAFADAGKTGIGIANFKFSGTCDYGIRMINCTRFRMQDLWFNFGNAVANVSDLTNDCINLGDSWGGLIQRVYAYIETATTTPARSVIWAEGAINGTTISRLETAAGSQYGIWLGDEDLTGDDDPALPSGCSFEGLTLQRHEIALYAKRCRGVSINGFYAEFNQIAIRCGSDDSTTDRCANLIVNGGHITSLDGTTYGWADNSTGAIELVRAYGCAFNSINFSDYGSGDSEQMLYVKRAYGCAVNNPTRFNFAMSDMRPAISFDGSVDANSRVTVTGNGTYGEQTLCSIGTTVVSTEYGSAAPSSGDYVVGDRVRDIDPASGVENGWVCTVAGNPGTWEPVSGGSVVVTSVAALASATSSYAYATCYSVADDGGGGWFEARESGDDVDYGHVMAHGSGGDWRWHRLGVNQLEYRVTHFGAYASNSTDHRTTNTTAFQRMVDAIFGTTFATRKQIDGAAMIVPPGRYYIDDEIVIPSYNDGWRLTGIGCPEVIQYTDNTPIFRFVIPNDITDDVTGRLMRDFYIADFTLSHRNQQTVALSPSGTKAYAIALAFDCQETDASSRGFANFVIERIQFKNCYRSISEHPDMVDYIYFAQYSIRDCRFYSSTTGPAFYMSSGVDVIGGNSDMGSPQCHWVRNWIQCTNMVGDEPAIQVNSAQTCIFDDIEFNQNDDITLMDLQTCGNVTIRDLKIEDVGATTNDRSLININATTGNVKIDGCEWLAQARDITATTCNLIRCATPRNVTITGGFWFRTFSGTDTGTVYLFKHDGTGGVTYDATVMHQDGPANWAVCPDDTIIATSNKGVRWHGAIEYRFTYSGLSTGTSATAMDNALPGDVYMITQRGSIVACINYITGTLTSGGMTAQVRRNGADATSVSFNCDNNSTAQDSGTGHWRMYTRAPEMSTTVGTAHVFEPGDILGCNINSYGTIAPTPPDIQTTFLFLPSGVGLTGVEL
jgi:hypothetical protein